MDAKERMLRMLSKGKVPDMADLKLEPLPQLLPVVQFFLLPLQVHCLKMLLQKVHLLKAVIQSS